MEELQSTELLEREILEDARKKALRILKAADDTIISNTADWEKKTSVTFSELEEKYDEYRELACEKVMARLPIDKLRIKIEKIEGLITDAKENWYKNLSRLEIVELLCAELLKRFSICNEISASAKKNVYYSALEQKEAQEILKKINVDCNIKEVPSTDHYPSITVEAENVRIIASIKSMLDFLLLEKREELVEALVGRDFMVEA